MTSRVLPHLCLPVNSWEGSLHRDCAQSHTEYPPSLVCWLYAVEIAALEYARSAEAIIRTPCC
eukprot:3123298-Amphidinium_carterae.1